MTKICKFEEYGKYFLIHPFHVDEPIEAEGLLQNLRNVSTDLDVQLVNLDKVAGRKHLYFAILNSLNAFAKGTNISRTLAMEFLLYASAQKQISEAIKRMGVDKETRNIAIVAMGGNEQSIRFFVERLAEYRSDDALLDGFDKGKINELLSTFKISEKELKAMTEKRTPIEETIQKLIIERMALLPTMI